MRMFVCKYKDKYYKFYRIKVDILQNFVSFDDNVMYVRS